MTWTTSGAAAMTWTVGSPYTRAATQFATVAPLYMLPGYTLELATCSACQRADRDVRRLDDAGGQWPGQNGLPSSRPRRARPWPLSRRSSTTGRPSTSAFKWRAAAGDLAPWHVRS